MRGDSVFVFRVFDHFQRWTKSGTGQKVGLGFGFDHFLVMKLVKRRVLVLGAWWVDSRSE